MPSRSEIFKLRLMTSSLMLSFIGLSAGLQVSPMAMKQAICHAESSVTMLAGGATIGEDAAKAAWLANQDVPQYGPKAGKAGARRRGTTGKSAAATVAAAKAAWTANQAESLRKPSAYRTPSMGDNSPAARPAPVPMGSSEPSVARRSVYAPPAVAVPVPAAPAPVPYTMVGVSLGEAAAKSAWLAKLDAPKWGPKANQPKPSRKPSAYRKPSMGDNV